GGNAPPAAAGAAADTGTLAARAPAAGGSWPRRARRALRAARESPRGAARTARPMDTPFRRRGSRGRDRDAARTSASALSGLPPPRASDRSARAESPSPPRARETSGIAEGRSRSARRRGARRSRAGPVRRTPRARSRSPRSQAADEAPGIQDAVRVELGLDPGHDAVHLRRHRPPDVERGLHVRGRAL